MNIYAGMHGGAAAAEQARRMRQEEEEMTPYQPVDLAEDWEFKILRSATSAFRNQGKLQQILEDEGRAGWVLVEKFDNTRLRLKRRASARKQDQALGFDPYRTYVGVSPNMVAFWIVVASLAVVGGIVGLAAL